MRRAAVPAIVVLSLAATLLGTTAAQEGSDGSPATPTSDGFVLETITHAIVVDAMPFPQSMLLMRVTLPPGASIPITAHLGPSVLLVESGVICFQLTDEPSPDAKVQVRTTASGDAADADAVNTAALAADCPLPPPECAQVDGCSIAAPAEFLLTAGDSVSQSLESLQSLERRYENIGSDPAIVLISELVTEGPGLPCGGGCP